jgi:hypothetical protein
MPLYVEGDTIKLYCPADKPLWIQPKKSSVSSGLKNIFRWLASFIFPA